MSLRKKTFLISAITVAGLLLGLYGASLTIMLPSYEALEERNARRNVERFQNVLADNLSYFNNELRDWAAWDESYSFIAGANPHYMKKHAPEGTFIDLKLNLMAFIHPSGRLYYGKGFDLKNKKTVPLPESLSEHLQKDRPLRQLQDPKSSLTGILLLPEGPMFVAAQPIITSERKGPSRGLLIFGRYLDETEIERLAQVTQVSIKVYRFHDPRMPADLQAVRPLLSPEKPFFIKPLNEEAIAGYTFLPDIYKKPALLLRLDMPRDIYKQGQATIRYFILTLLLVGLIIGGLALFLLEKTILSRLANLSEKVRDIEVSRDYSQRMLLEGKDEITELSREINLMLASLEEYSEKLKELSITDGLTALYNHRHFYERLEEEVKRAERYNYPLSLMIIDVDYFKNYNDARGHLEGDSALKEMALIIEKNVREHDIVARYGGDEFSIILPETDRERAKVLAERIKRSMAEKPFFYEENHAGGYLTLSIGVAAFSDDACDPQGLIKKADEALYRAKNGGRNRVEGG